MVARVGRFSRSLTPFGTGSLSFDDLYAVERQAQEASSPPTPGQPPPREPAPPGGKPTVPVPKPPKVGKTPVAKTVKPKPKAQAPVTRSPVKPAPAKITGGAKAAVKNVGPKAAPTKALNPPLAGGIAYTGIPAPPKPKMLPPRGQ